MDLIRSFLEDEKSRFIGGRVISSFKLTQDRWETMLKDDENRNYFGQFLKDPKNRRLFFSLNSKNLLSASPTQFTKGKKALSVYKLKCVGPEDAQEFIRSLAFVEIPKNPIGCIHKMLDNVYGPLSKSDQNVSRFSKPVANDILTTMSDITGDMYLLLGKSKGMTVLSIPPQEILHSDDSPSRLHSFESQVIQWIEQIQRLVDTQFPEDFRLTPMDEVKYWKKRRENFEFLRKQLKMEEIEIIMNTLEFKSKPFVDQFKTMKKKVKEELKLAIETERSLQPLSSFVEQIDTVGADMEGLTDMFQPVFYLLYLMYKKTKYYHSPRHICNLLRRVSDFFTIQFASAIDGSSLVNGDPADSMEHLIRSQESLMKFNSAYVEFKEKILAQDGPSAFTLNNNIVMPKFLDLCNRLDQLKPIIETIIEFNRFDKTEVGGLHGHILSPKFADVLNDFHDIEGKLTGMDIDLLKVPEEQFTEIINELNDEFMNLDIRAVAIAIWAIKDVSSIVSLGQVLSGLNALLRRPFFIQTFKQQYTMVVNLFSQDVSLISVTFRQGKDNPPKLQGIPDTTSRFVFFNGLLQRLQNLKDTLKNTIPEIFNDPAMKEALKQMKDVKDSIEKTMGKKINNWSSTISGDYKDKLKLHLMIRDPKTRLLSLNFDPELRNLLQEVKFLENHINDEIPEVAKEIYKNNKIYNEYIHMLQVLIERYNHPLSTIVDIERPMFQRHIDAVDKTLEEGISTLTWESEGTSSFLETAVQEVSKFSDLHNKSTSNIATIRNKIDSWRTPALFSRPDVKKSLDQNEVNNTLNSRIALITTQCAEIDELVRSSVSALTDDPDSHETKQYLDYIMSIVKDGFMKNIMFSFNQLLKDLNPGSTSANRNHAAVPLITTKLELIDNNVLFSPPLIEGDNNLFQTFKDWCARALDLCKLIKVFYEGQPELFSQIADDENVKTTVDKILSAVETMAKKCIQYKEDNFEKYSNVWTQSQETYIQEFLETGGGLSEPDKLTGERKPMPPSLDDFGKQISSYRNDQNDIRLIQDSHSFGWLRVDCRPLKQSLDLNLGKWVYLFTHYLNNDMLKQLKEFKHFLKEANAGLDVKVNKGDIDQLVAVLEAMLLIRTKAPLYEKLFDNLKATVALLKQYGVTVTDSLMAKIERGPEQWQELKNNWSNVQDKVAPLQQEETARLRAQEESFVESLIEIKEEFGRQQFYKWEIGYSRAREIIEDWEEKIGKISDDAAEIQANGELLEFSVNPFKNLQQMKADLVLLTNVWEIAHDIEGKLQKWKDTLWSEIDIAVLSNECENYTKTIRKIEKRAKEWGVYTGLDALIKSVSSAMPILDQLHNDKLRDRHWNKLEKITGVNFQKEIDLKLGDMLKKDLMKYSEDITEVVDGANNEVRMETQLADLDKTWRDMEFQYKEMPEFPELEVLNAPEELIQTLEENQVAVMNYLSSKNISYFKVTLTEWQTKLMNVDRVLNVWLEVQSHWTHLRPIFIGSEDIRQQLPTQSESFERIDKEMNQFIKEQKANVNVIDTCNQPNIQKFLEAQLRELTVVEKSLNEYLETKRMAFPRFYFVSSNDLLDILSKGRNPKDIEEHFGKVFDNLVKVEWTGPRTCKAMISREGEKVDFDEEIELKGAVEHWLQLLLDTAKETLKHKLADAISSAYDTNQRPKWIVNNFAQIGLTAVCIQWNKEVNTAFKQLEEGIENAMRDYNIKQNQQLGGLIELIRSGNLSPLNRKKVTVICQTDAHNRDVVFRLNHNHEETHECFEWQSQLRFSWRNSERDCFINIIDAEFRYQYEYLGSPSRLVVTPLTDRCYITLTQSLRRIMGGAPAGPAGTGKTETVKDLARAMGQVCFVFNCSEQMDHESLAATFKGLSQAGAWGCFDEFNRIAARVLSVVSIQVKSILDALRANMEEFKFCGGELIKLKRTCGMFITMNPGYLGRTELPENIKALFRSVSMCVPDFQIICEIMLMAEGFKTASLLTKKFTTLYSRCDQLLSKQQHYDWGLRAVKSVLVVAGSLRSADPNMSEEAVLMRALRDFNIPKIITTDLPVFLGLINDLFPAIDVPRKRNLRWEEQIRQTVLHSKLQAEDQFIRKVVELEELLGVRHSVFIIGGAGNGKTEVWRALSRSYSKKGTPCSYVDLNPKAVTNNELFGFLNTQTRDWQDGLFSCIMRNLAKMTHENPKWIVLDGDIDPNWIESLNTVMDDNKVLTLASNERIPLTTHMRLIFEIAHLKYATPATVSRAGILYVNDTDVGFMAYAYSWIDKRTNGNEKSQLTVLFNNYVPRTIEIMHNTLQHIVPLTDVGMVHTLCRLLEGLLTEKNVPANADASLYELYFVFAAVWAFGGACDDQGRDYRLQFNQMWRSEWRNVVFPQQGTVFDYCINPDTKKFMPWSEVSPKYEYIPGQSVASTLVFVPETTRLNYISKMLVENGHPVMLAGIAGTGKSVLIRNLLQSFNEVEFMFRAINFNYYTTSTALQAFLESALEMKSGKLYAPPAQKKCIYFIDDMNMPAIDQFGTQSPMTLLRQHLDYQHWYDRQAMTIKDVKGVNYVSCMNPTAGSFTINPRLQRHFSTFALGIPSDNSVKQILSSMLFGHLDHYQFQQRIRDVAQKCIDTMLAIQREISAKFMPTAIRFHYIFNMRDLCQLLQGLLRSTTNYVKSPDMMARLLATEAIRVYADRLIDLDDYQKAKDIIITSTIKSFEGMIETQVLRDEMMFCAFPPDGDEASFEENGYAPMVSFEMCTKVINDQLVDYNESHTIMNLVLFKDAIEHVLRISRGITAPNGHMLLVGLGGSGKQSLVRLAADLVGFSVFQITLANNYGMNEFYADLIKVFIQTGGKKYPTVFLLTDAQVTDEKFLIPISDFLSTGVLPDIFSQEDKEIIYSAVKGDMKVHGIPFTPDDAMKFFTSRVRQYMRVVFCQSPSGDTFRIRARRFPALVNCMIIDWFHPWPDDALYSVAKSFLSELELDGNDPEVIVQFIANAHSKVIKLSDDFFEAERRHNYATPKSYLELISLFKSMLEKTRNMINNNANHFSKGLKMLQDSSKDVEVMKIKLQKQTQIVDEKRAECVALIEKISQDTAIVKKESEIAQREEAKTAKIKAEAEEKQAIASEELKKAQPLKEQALAAIDCIEKAALTELASFSTPPAAVDPVMQAVVLILSPGNRPARDLSWRAAKKLMSNTSTFLTTLQRLPEFWNNDIMQLTKQRVAKWTFKEADVRKASTACANLYVWLNNILNYHTVIQNIIPKERAAKEAEELLIESVEKLKKVQAKAKNLEDQLNKLKDELESQQQARNDAQAEAQSMADKITRATELVAGLGDEGIRWAHKIEEYKEEVTTVVGDVLLAAAFVSYAGPFTRPFRERLVEDIWKPFLDNGNVKYKKDPLDVICNEALIATWNNQGLPNDHVSIENAAITSSCQRWPLFIDPQFQGIKWIRNNQEANNLRVLRFGQDNFVNTLVMAVENGESVLIENVGEQFDPIIDPLLGRNVVRRGRRNIIQIGDREVEFNEKFKLYLQTKLANPNFKPEYQAQTTVINFTVTLDGLEEQLLGYVVKHEKPGLEEEKARLITQMNEDKITMQNLEDDLLNRLSKPGANLIEDTDLMNTLDKSKVMSAELTERVQKAIETGQEISQHREAYRRVAGRAALLYFILVDLAKIDHMYQFSLSSFVTVFTAAMDEAEASTNPVFRENALVDSITFKTFRWAMRGLFQRHQMIFTALLCFRILLGDKQIQSIKMDEFMHLLRCPRSMAMPNPAPEWLSDSCWGAAVGLGSLQAFNSLPQDITMRTKPWQKWCDLEMPENEKLPLDYKNKTEFQRLLVIRALRPDRMVNALTQFISNQIGEKYTEDVVFSLQQTYEESTPLMALFFILSPGIDPVKNIEILGEKYGFTEEKGTLYNISLGEGQEENALNALSRGAKEGGWVICQNLHLMGSWLMVLEKHIEKLRMEELHPTFRIFYTGEPCDDIPAGLLQNSIKITSEPARGTKANLMRALSLFSDDTMEQCQKDREYKALLFHLCVFHAIMVERRKFGPQGFNKVYNFNPSDLQICAELLFDSLDQAAPIPWVPLRYLIGEIMYGGHISDDRDRRLCKTYLESFDKDDFEGAELVPGFPAPTSLATMEEYKEYALREFPDESPYIFGMHPNAEIGSLTTQTDFIFNTLLNVQPRVAGSEEGDTSMEKSVKRTLEEIIPNIPEPFNIQELYNRVEKHEPYVSICLQECERMNILMAEIKRSLSELLMGLSGELTISEAMDTLMMAIYVSSVPSSWEKLAYASLRPLMPWWKDLLDRHKQLVDWSAELTLPTSVWLPGLFNPSSFLTAVAQSAARKNGWPLDQTVLTVEVTKKQESDIDVPPRDGAYIHGLFLEGARWDSKMSSLNEAFLKELYPQLPVIYVRAVYIDKPQGGRSAVYYECPVYVTKLRGPTYVSDFNLKINPNLGSPSHWVKSGVAILLEA
ncbi:Dynein heavy chain family protein [Tritrichomonas foetus]|uniref:Dynein-1, subspecies f n=1 Tax=Tritrichomonas foetus TaxID=1144522 RepID=A0A1J4J947_9EUKA|nr:Dynein heavy chain family protein [Tritrichomonas foetus]|eukprot:OHS95209.1 Dynein heavy chain family protein [Tritrichomonas foetus]